MKATFRVVETDTEETAISTSYRSFLAVAEPKVSIDPENEEAYDAEYSKQDAVMPQEFAIRNLRQIQWALGVVEIVTDEKLAVGVLVSLELTIQPEP